jgi:hypothetical protein
MRRHLPESPVNSEVSAGLDSARLSSVPVPSGKLIDRSLTLSRTSNPLHFAAISSYSLYSFTETSPSDYISVGNLSLLTCGAIYRSNEAHLEKLCVLLETFDARRRLFVGYLVCDKTRHHHIL